MAVLSRNQIERLKSTYLPGSIVRSNRGRGEYIARVVDFSDEHVYFDLLECPPYCKLPIFAWKIKWATILVGYWRVVGAVRPRLKMGAKERLILQRSVQLKVLPRLREHEAEQVLAGKMLPIGVDVNPNPELLFSTPDGRRDEGIVGYLNIGEVVFFVYEGDWIVTNPDGQKRVVRKEEFEDYYVKIEESGRDTEFVRSFGLIQESVHTASKKSGKWDVGLEPTVEQELVDLQIEVSRLALALSTQSEDDQEGTEEFSDPEMEIAEVIIRLMDFAASRRMKIAKAIEAKIKAGSQTRVAAK